MFEKVQKNFGFGCMRLPMKDGEVDHEAFCEMVDLFLERGFNYFDTAHGYLDGKSETALRRCLTSRYPREAYVLTNKLSSPHFKKQEDIRPLFQSQLEACGVEYFDFYLMHAQCAKLFEKYQRCRAYETALELKDEGKIRHFGISFHDRAVVLEKILRAYPQIEVVQLQFNYIDYEDPAVESRKCYEVCRKYGKSVIVMEPVKGGSLVELPPEAQQIFDRLQGGSNANYAIRFAAGFEGIMMVLSGMGNLAMVEENTGYMQQFRPLNEQELAAVEQVCGILKAQNLIQCTGCRYCTEVCVKEINIPALFANMNAKKRWGSWNSDYYNSIHTQNGGKPEHCIKCGACEQICPQHLPIRSLLEEVSQAFGEW